MTTTTSPTQTAAATNRAVLNARRQQPGALLPILQDIQDRLGHVPPEAVPQMAEALNLSRAKVHGVISCDHHFRAAKPKGVVGATLRLQGRKGMLAPV